MRPLELCGSDSIATNNKTHQGTATVRHVAQGAVGAYIDFWLGIVHDLGGALDLELCAHGLRAFAGRYMQRSTRT
eukprot:216638-Pyramimonas_sp.AAC.1